MHVRLEYSAANANKIAHYLQEHAKVQNVYYPGLQTHLGFNIQQSQATSAGAVLSFTLQSEDALRQFLSKVKLPVFAVSLGLSNRSFPTQLKCHMQHYRKKLVMKEGFQIHYFGYPSVLKMLTI